MNIATRIKDNLFVRTDLTGSGLYMTYTYKQTGSYRHLYIIEMKQRDYYIISHGIRSAAANHMIVCEQMNKRI